ncbi:hypothetical protein SAY86_009947 [Trapa natans]|uniref:acid phosphatase n=1 Tax=Trapa natans TaxID=22666 RepID=A0AAN7L5R1_TRANT|nr:hypothetical protein SAY86_009947 [Trapa natans]
MGGTRLLSIPPRSSSSVSSFTALLVLVLVLILNGAMVCYGGKTSTFARKVEKAVDMPLDSDVFQVPSGYNAPQQVHITQGDQVGKAVIVSWVTVDEPGSSVVLYWSENSHLKKKKAEGKYETYKFHNYNSGYIHHCTVRNLEYSTKYYYEVGIEHTGETEPFKPFTKRYRVPYQASGSTAPFWYSIKRASAYIIVLSSYSAYGETMRVMYEAWFVKFKVDVVFAGHVHAYERSERVSNIAYNVVNGECTPASDQSAPVYITIGDGGNLEGLATNMTEPQPQYSAYREASFGHAVFDIKNRTHAYYSWHRNQDGYAVEADRLWFYNRYWKPVHEPTSF